MFQVGSPCNKDHVLHLFVRDNHVLLQTVTCQQLYPVGLYLVGYLLLSDVKPNAPKPYLFKSFCTSLASILFHVELSKALLYASAYPFPVIVDRFC